MASPPSATTSSDGLSRLRAAGRIARLGLLFLYCLPPHLVARLGKRTSPWPRRFLTRATRIAGVELEADGVPLDAATLLLANHTSWLDILILGAATGTRFVSKAEVGTVPLIGWLAEQNHTVYIDRSERGEARRQVRQVATALADPKPLAIFPEGTTSDGRALLPFRSTLLAAVAPPPSGVVVRPVTIDYGAAVTAIAWHGGEAGVANALRVLGLRGRRRVTVRVLDPLPASSDRKALAKEAQAAIGAALPDTRSS